MLAYKVQNLICIKILYNIQKLIICQRIINIKQRAYYSRTYKNRRLY